MSQLLFNHYAEEGPVIKTIIPMVLGQDYEYSLNASTCMHKDKCYIAYRIEKYPYFSIPVLMLAEFNLETNATVGDTHIPLQTLSWSWTGLFHTTCPYPEYHQEDPRLLSYGDQLLMTFGDGFNMYYSTFDPDHLVDSLTYSILKPPSPAIFPNVDGREKNWTPFIDLSGLPRLIYSLEPFVVLDLSGRVLSNIHSNISFYADRYGDPRGGTPSYEFPEYGHKDAMITFFHSKILRKGCPHPQGERHVYFTGAAVHTSDKLLALSRHPLIAGSPMNDRTKTSPCALSEVVFPAGAIRTKKGFMISYGANDIENRILEISVPEILFNITDI